MVINCNKCDGTNEYNESDYFWDENGFGYSTELVRCKDCGCMIIVKVIEDNNLDVNNDKRYYRY